MDPDSGFLPANRIGRRVRIKRSDFDALLEASYTGGKRSPTEGDLGRRGPVARSAERLDTGSRYAIAERSTVAASRKRRLCARQWY